MKAKNISLLYDRLVTNPHIEKPIKDLLKKAFVIEASNVSDYYFQGSDQEYWHLGTDFPNVAPPFETFYIEFRAPHEIVSRVNGVTPWHKELPSKWGVLCLSSEMDDVWDDFDTDEGKACFSENILKQIERLHLALGNKTVQEANQCWASHDVERLRALRQRIPENLRMNLDLYIASLSLNMCIRAGEWEEAKKFIMSHKNTELFRWDMDCILFAQFPDSQMQQSLGPFFAWEMHIKPDGRLHVSGDGTVMMLYKAMGSVHKNIERVLREDHDEGIRMFEAVKDTFGKFLHTALLAISFTHCKNVTLSQHLPPKIQPTQKQKRWKMQPPQPVTYHVLDIDPMKQVLRAEGQAEKTGIQRALHICRGHFAHYDENHKLFGKYAGTFWKPQHIRGSQHIGIASKDYRIKHGAKG